MIIRFKLGEYKDIYEKYYELLSHEPDIETEEEDDEFFSVRPYRIFVPDLKLAIREGCWFVHSSRCLPEPEEDDWEDEEEYGFPAFSAPWTEENEWEEHGSVFLTYEENEEDPARNIYYTTGGIFYTLMCTLKDRDKNITAAECDELECFIDTDEFISEDEAYRLTPDESEPEE